MPRKGNRPSVANLKKKIIDKDVNEKNKDKEKVLDELAVRLKLNKENGDLEKHDEGSELEEDLETEDFDLNLNLDLQNLEFHQFMQLPEESERGAPVLERIAGSQPRPIFVGAIPRETGTTAGGADSKEEFKYVPGAETGNQETKYFAEPGIENAPERIDLTRAGRTGSFREEISQERFFMQSEPRTESQSQERFERPERFDAEKAGRRNQFERPEAKYEKYRPKLPKSF